MNSLRTIHDGGQAFPMSKRDDALSGMSLRDYFAGKALEGLIACPGTGSGGQSESDVADYFAQCSYLYADAMLRERAKSTT